MEEDPSWRLSKVGTVRVQRLRPGAGDGAVRCRTRSLRRGGLEPGDAGVASANLYGLPAEPLGGGAKAWVLGAGRCPAVGGGAFSELNEVGRSEKLHAVDDGRRVGGCRAATRTSGISARRRGLPSARRQCASKAGGPLRSHIGMRLALLDQEGRLCPTDPRRSACTRPGALTPQGRRLFSRIAQPWPPPGTVTGRRAGLGGQGRGRPRRSASVKSPAVAEGRVGVHAGAALR